MSFAALLQPSFLLFAFLHYSAACTLFSSNGRPFKFHVYPQPQNWSVDMSELMDNTSTASDACQVFLALYLPLHPCHTANPDDADAFVVAALVDAFGRGGPTVNSEVKTQYLHAYFATVKEQNYWSRHRGYDHFAYNGWMTGWWRNFIENLRYITAENYLVTQALQKHATAAEVVSAWREVVVMPYSSLTMDRFFSDDFINTFPRDKLLVFLGSLTTVAARIRGKCRDQMAAHPDDTFWADLSHGQHHVNTSLLTTFWGRGVFGLSPPGDSPSARRTFSMLFAGTIPVVVTVDPFPFVQPFESLLDWSDFSISVTEHQLEEHNIVDLLKAIPAARVHELQNNVRRVRHHFMYHEGKPLHSDALDFFVRELASRTSDLRGVKRFLSYAS